MIERCLRGDDAARPWFDAGARGGSDVLAPLGSCRCKALRMRRLVVGLALLAALALPAGAAAHPLGNFTVNRYAGIEVAGSSTYVRYALDLAEIPTYQLGAEVRAPGYASTLARRLELTLDGQTGATSSARYGV